MYEGSILDWVDVSREGCFYGGAVKLACSGPPVKEVERMSGDFLPKLVCRPLRVEREGLSLSFFCVL